MYTDGRKDVVRGRFVGIECYYANGKKKVGSLIPFVRSIFTAECMAILKALDLIRKSQHSHFTVISHSFSVPMSLSSSVVSVRTNYYIFEKKGEIICYNLR